MIGVSCIAREFGAGELGQALAALVCATIPSGVLASSGARNNYFIAMWLVLAVYFAMRFAANGKAQDASLLGVSLGCALFTKATAYLFAPCLILAILILNRRVPVKPLLVGSVGCFSDERRHELAAICQKLSLSGSILGFDSAHADGVYRWRNETFSFKNTVSNALRNVSEQLGGRDPRWNRRVYQTVVSLHQAMGADVSDPNTTWPWTVYESPRNANHEGNVPNTGHLAFLVCISIVLPIQSVRTGDYRWLGYLGALGFGFIVFCAYLQWQQV